MDTEHGSHTPADGAEVRHRPYRWGYFQGAILIPFSLIVLLDTASNQVQSDPDPWYLAAIGYLGGIIGLVLSIGILRKRRYALPLIYVISALSLVFVAIDIPFAVKHFASQGRRAGAFFDTEIVLFWMLSIVYYRKRREQLH
jgi:hypothetical protein